MWSYFKDFLTIQKQVITSANYLQNNFSSVSFQLLDEPRFNEQLMVNTSRSDCIIHTSIIHNAFIICLDYITDVIYHKPIARGAIVHHICMDTVSKKWLLPPLGKLQENCPGHSWWLHNCNELAFSLHLQLVQCLRFTYELHILGLSLVAVNL